MKQLYTYSAFLIALNLCSIPCSADFSFKSISSWVSNHKNKDFFEEMITNDAPHIILTTQAQGTITVKTWSLSKVVVQGTLRGSDKALDETDVQLQASPSEIVIKTKIGPSSAPAIDFQLMVPYRTKLTITAKSSTIKIKKVEGPIAVTTQTGTIDIHDAISAVTAKSQQSITVTMAQVGIENTINLTSEKGSINLGLPRRCNATINAKTTNKSVESEFPILIKPCSMELNAKTYKKLTQHITGTIGTGQTAIKIEANNGIYLHHSVIN